MARRQGGSAVLGFALGCALLLLGLAAAVRRQSHALELVRDVERTRAELALAEAQRAELIKRLGALQSRARVTQQAGLRGLRLPAGDEIVILPEAPSVAQAAASRP